MPILELYSPRMGNVPEKSGLNWGLADAHVSTADAYIALRQEFFLNYPDFFPPHGSVINVVWDDGTRMTCLLEGTQHINGNVEPKQISTYDDKSELGIYLRDRIGVTYDHLIRIEDLEGYGRTDIDVSRLDNGDYYFDFSV